MEKKEYRHLYRYFLFNEIKTNPDWDNNDFSGIPFFDKIKKFERYLVAGNFDKVLKKYEVVIWVYIFIFIHQK